MLRSAASKVMWVGRATVFLVGLAVILALVFGVASMALGANGESFVLGKKNVATKVSKLVRNAGGPALSLQVGSGKPPLKVNAAAGKATNLNADELDGEDSGDFAPAGSAPLWAKVNADGTLDGSQGIDDIVKGPTGIYNVSFDRGVSKCAFVATLVGSGAQGEISGRYDAEDLDIYTWTSDGPPNQRPANKAFNLMVAC